MFTSLESIEILRYGADKTVLHQEGLICPRFEVMNPSKEIYYPLGKVLGVTLCNATLNCGLTTSHLKFKKHRFIMRDVSMSTNVTKIHSHKAYYVMKTFNTLVKHIWEYYLENTCKSCKRHG